MKAAITSLATPLLFKLADMVCIPGMSSCSYCYSSLRLGGGLPSQNLGQQVGCTMYEYLQMVCLRKFQTTWHLALHKNRLRRLVDLSAYICTCWAFEK
jgi:hypothetical protein